jgi:regulatory protein
MATESGQVTVADAREFACRYYLANREHSRKELRDKLARKGISSSIIAEAIDSLTEEGLVSDLRFAEAFTRSRVSRLYGPLKIRSELMKRGVESRFIDQTLELHSETWFESAQSWVLKRVRGKLDRQEKARLYRSGTSRGFTHEQMFQAFDAIPSED